MVDMNSGLKRLSRNFKQFVNEKPWIIQKVSIQGICLVCESIMLIKNQYQNKFELMSKKAIIEQNQEQNRLPFGNLASKRGVAIVLSFYDY